MHPRRLIQGLAAAVLAVGALLAASGPLAAQGAVGIQDDAGLTAGAKNPGPKLTPVMPRRGGTPATCTADDGTVGRVGYKRLSDDLLNEEERALVTAGGGIYWKTCGGQPEGKIQGTGLGGIFIPPRTPGGPPADPGDLAEEALERAPLPGPIIGMAPRPDIPQLVNLPTFLWIPADQWKPFSVSASAGPVTSTVTATPKRVIWDMGQGDTISCDGPGLPYDPNLTDDANPSTCRYTYRRSSAGQPNQSLTVTATMEWETNWTVTGAAGGGGLGTVSRSASTTIKVAELQALNIGARR